MISLVSTCTVEAAGGSIREKKPNYDKEYEIHFGQVELDINCDTKYQC